MIFQNTIENKFDTWAENARTTWNLPLSVTLWDGRTFNLGDFAEPKVQLSVQSVKALPALLNASLDTLGEAYIEGHIDVDGSLQDVIELAYQLAEISDGSSMLGRAARLFAHSREDDREAIAYHYDVSNDFYQLWLDSAMVYSCAYFPSGNESLEQAQIAKIEHILRKVQLQPGQRLLDIGCGWGALVLHAAKTRDVTCVGVTLSQSQYDFACARVAEAGLADRVEIRLQDYRDISGSFDRITSVGMFEHVGLKNLPEYFSHISGLLADDGLVLNHGITSTDADSCSTALGGGDFIEKYVFPQGELPHISMVLNTMQQGGLEALDIENLRRHYARTLKLWSERYEAQSMRLRPLVTEKTFRIWRVYLAACAYAFDVDNVAIYQVLCQKDRRLSSNIPWSREFMYV